jgi:hypothetical protein
MSDNPRITDKYPSLVISGYKYSAKGKPLTIKWIFGKLRSASNSLETSISWLIYSHQAFISHRFLDGVQVAAFVSSSTCHFFTSFVLRALALAFALLPACPAKETSLKV